MSDLVKDNLCSNDPRSTFYIELDDDPRPARINCFCENCFSGKDKLAVRIAELEADIQAIEKNTDWQADRIAELEADLAKAKLSNKGMHKTIERLTDTIMRVEELPKHPVLPGGPKIWVYGPDLIKALGEAK